MGSIIWFKEISKDDVAKVGGKGANLGEMYNAGMPIPPGFCVSAKAYEKFVNSTELNNDIMKILSGLDCEDTAKLQDASEKIQEMVIFAKMPESLSEEIISAYGKLEGFVAVRSSATAEDLPEASFAGQQATYLNVSGAESVVKKVQECWASLFTSRAIYYREKNGFKHSEVLISVVVQKMVQSDTAGVMFTANPVTNDLSEVMIEGSFGLGEMVVSGSVSPDNYIVSKEPLNVKSIYVAEKRRAMYRAEDGSNKEIELDPDKANSQVLNKKQIIALAKIGIEIEKHYGKPQDIEWAIENEEIFITQSRPITTLK
jgi:pyruvate,water dikinase